ncbi:MAG: hypothetical protein NVS2B6_13620 [Thermoleophilaceae bacterium]
MLVLLVALALPVSASAEAAPVRISFSTANQGALAQSGRLDVRIRAAPGTRFSLSAHAGRVAITLSRAVRVGRSGRVALALPVAAGARSMLGRCAALRVSLSVHRIVRTTHASRRPRGSTIRRSLPPDPRSCRRTASSRGAGSADSGGARGPAGGVAGGRVEPPPVGPRGERTLVGAATRSITPPGPEYATHVGGYGDCKGCDQTGGTTEVNPGDDLKVRAVVVRRGSKAVVLASADLEGWFAGYKQGPGLGLNDLRKQVADELSRPVGQGGQGLAMGSEDIIVQSIHCHACPTVVGIWGKTNVRYLGYVYEQARAAIEEAAANARPAALEWSTADIGYVNGVQLGIANANEGWPIDGQLSILRARDASNGETIATYANVPAHGNIVHGPDSHKMSSEYFGAADRWLEGHLGGTAVVAPGTLGDQTTPMQATDSTRALAVDARLGALVGSTIDGALTAHAHPITDPTLGGAEQYLVVPFTNPALAGSDCQEAITQIVGIQIDRSCEPPYAIASTGLGVWFTTLRIGSIAVASEPGEAFPHVSFAVRRVLSGAQAVFTAGQAQDQLGYYYEPWAFPTTFIYSADHNIFHASMALAEANAQVQVPNGTQLGFAVTPSAIDPTGNDFSRVAHPGVQVWGYPQAAEAGQVGGATIWIGVYRAPARCSGAPGLCSPDPGDATVDFGDGSPPATAGSSSGGGFDPAVDIEHTFPHPGDYEVKATLRSGETWTSTVHVKSATVVTNTAHYPSQGTVFDSPGQSGR